MSRKIIPFGQLRSLVQTPSFYNWRMLCGTLDRYEDQWEDAEMAETVLPYLRAHIDRWPDTLRRWATHTWVFRGMREAKVPQLELASAIEFVGHQTTPSGLNALFALPNLRRVTHVDLRKAEACDASVIRTIVDNPHMTDLRSLALSAGRRRRLPGRLRVTLEARGIELMG
jgi:hypothetical protein